MANEFDVVVIGAGTGGYVAAIRASQLGLKTAVVEKQKALGGTCLIWGCIPTKALLEHAHALKVVQNVKEWGVTIGEARVGIDMNQVQTRKDKVVTGLTKGIEFLFKKNKIEWIKGTAAITGRGTSTSFDGDKQTLAAPGKSSSPPDRRREACRASRSIANGSSRATKRSDLQRSARSRWSILGSGAVGVEFASIFRRFGSQVTIIELLPRIVPAEDEADLRGARKIVQKTGHHRSHGHEGDQGDGVGDGVDVEAQLRRRHDPKNDRRLSARRDRPRARDSGIDVERSACIWIGAISRSTRCSAPVSRVFRRLATSFIAREARRIRSSRMCRRPRASSPPSGLRDRTSKPINYDHVPGCTYCDPEIGSVGLTEREAQEKGFDVRVGTFPFFVLGRAKMAGEAEGFVKIVADKKYDEVLGVHMIGPRATELVAEATLALRLECTVEELIRTIHAHPTFSEAVGEAAHATHGAAIHM